MATVMIIGLHQQMSSHLQTILEQAGYHVVTAADGRNALIEAKVCSPIIFVIDTGLRDINWFEVVLRLKLEAATKVATIVMMTHEEKLFRPSTGGPTFGEAYQAGIESALEKPEKPYNILAVVNRFMQLIEAWTTDPQRPDRNMEARELTELKHKWTELLSKYTQRRQGTTK